MAMTSINVRVDEQVKKRFTWLCDDIGMNISTAINVFMKAALRENRFPFPLEADPYFTGETLRVLEQRKKAFDEGKRGVVMTMEELDGRINAS